MTKNVIINKDSNYKKTTNDQERATHKIIHQCPSFTKEDFWTTLLLSCWLFERRVHQPNDHATNEEGIAEGQQHIPHPEPGDRQTRVEESKPAHCKSVPNTYQAKEPGHFASALSQMDKDGQGCYCQDAHEQLQRLMQKSIHRSFLLKVPIT